MSPRTFKGAFGALLAFLILTAAPAQAAPGDLDPVGGKVITDASPASDSAFDVAVSSTGKIIVGGGTGSFPFGASDFLVVR